MTMSVVEAHVPPSKWEELKIAYRNATQILPPQICETVLIQSIDEPSLWKIVTIWHIKKHIRRIQNSTRRVGAAEIFRSLGIEPTQVLYNIVISAKATDLGSDLAETPIADMLMIVEDTEQYRYNSGMPLIAIASKNPVKGNAIIKSFHAVFPQGKFDLIAYDLPSGVRDQPVGDEETRLGAKNRMLAVRSICPQADFWTAIEGGVVEVGNQLSAFAWIVVSDKQRTGWSRSASFFLPDKVAELVRNGVELGHADDLVFGRNNSKQMNGAVGILTHDAIDREELYIHAIKLALIPFLNPELY